MIIDTEKLREAINAYFDNQGALIDKNIKDDNRAIRAFTRLETLQIREEESIIQIEELWKNYHDFVQ